MAEPPAADNISPAGIVRVKVKLVRDSNIARARVASLEGSRGRQEAGEQPPVAAQQPAEIEAVKDPIPNAPPIPNAVAFDNASVAESVHIMRRFDNASLAGSVHSVSTAAAERIRRMESVLRLFGARLSEESGTKVVVLGKLSDAFLSCYSGAASPLEMSRRYQEGIQNHCKKRGNSELYLKWMTEFPDLAQASSTLIMNSTY